MIIIIIIIIVVGYPQYPSQFFCGPSISIFYLFIFFLAGKGGGGESLRPNKKICVLPLKIRVDR